MLYAPIVRLVGLAGLGWTVTGALWAQPVTEPEAEAPAGALAARHIQALDAENRYLHSRIRNLESELETLATMPTPVDVDAERLRQENRNYSERIARLLEQLEEADQDRATLRRAEEQARRWRELILQQRDRLAEQERRLRGQASMQGETESLQARIRQLELALKGSEYEAGVVDQLREEARLVKAKLRLALEERQQMLDRQEALNRKAESLSEALEREKDSLRALEESRAALRTQVDALLDERDEYQVRAESANNEVARIRGARLKEQADLEALQQEVQAQQEELEALRVQRITAESRAIRAERALLRETSSPPSPAP